MSKIRIIIGLVVALAVAFSDGSALGQGKGNGKRGGGGGGGTPVFVVMNRDGFPMIQTLDAAGAVVKTLVDNHTTTGIPAPNGAGTKIAFYLPGGPAGNGIYVAPTDGSSGPSLLASTLGSVGGLAWSPVSAADGDVKIAWIENDGASGYNVLHLINEDGSEHIVLLIRPWGLYSSGPLRFSPNARFLAVSSPGQGFGLIEFIAVGGTVAIDSVTFPLTGIFPYETSAPAWVSATDVVFSVVSGGTAGPGLYRTNLTGGAPYLILAERSFAGGDVRPLYPNADPTTGKLVFEGARLKNGGVTTYHNRHVFTCDPDGTNAVQLTSKGKWWLRPMWL